MFVGSASANGFERRGRETLRGAYLWLGGSRPFQGARDRRLRSRTALTCDAFDTLITRPLDRPVNVFLLCGVALRERGIILMPEVAWREQRHAAELEIAAWVRPAEAVTRPFVERPTRAEATAYGHFPPAEDETHAQPEEIGKPFGLGPMPLWRQINAPAYHRRISHWPEASVVRTVPGWVEGPALRALGHMPGRRT